MTATVSPGEVLCGFRVLRRQALSGSSADAVEAVHERTGARVLSLAAADPENVFAVAFPTPPPDNCGLPHILEHVALAGSRSFPVRDPFAEMLKSSMATFLNAFTDADRTLYPVASNVVRDYFNLAAVYLDAVFRPLLSRDAFMQEGWHWTLRGTPSGALRPSLQGVALNEMASAFSDLDALVERETARHLFPAGTYGLDAGGEPECMPDLTYERFRAYHACRYHPAAACFFLYGNIPLDEKLRFLAARLDDLAPAPFQAPVLVRQAAWTRPRRKTVRLSDPLDDGGTGCAAAVVGWVLDDLRDPDTDLAWELLDRLLLGDDAAPLRRGLVEAGIGDDLTASGYGGDCLQRTFQVGLKGGRAMPLARVEPTVLRILEEAATSGFPKARVCDAFRQIEYSRRDMDTGFPIHLMEDAFAVWLYGLDPLAFLAVEPVIERLDGRVAKDPGLLGRMLRRHLLENPHRLSLRLLPQPGGRAGRQPRLATRARAFARHLSEAGLRDLRCDVAALAERQARPNPPEALATLPILQRRDLPAEPAAIRSSVETLANGSALLRHEVPSNGISYLTLALDLGSLPTPLLPYVPAYAALLASLGAGRLGHAELSEAVTRSTGGLTGNVHVCPDRDGTGLSRPFLVLQTRTLDETCEEAVALVAAILDDLQVAPNQRLRETLAQRRARLLASVVPYGHHLAALEAGRHLDPYHGLNHLWKGPPQLRLAHAMAAGDLASLRGAAEALASLRDWLRGCPVAFASLTGTDRVGRTLRGWLSSRAPAPSTPVVCATPAAPPAAEPQGGRPGALIGLAHDVDSAFCARCLPAPRWDSPAAPRLQIAAQILGVDYLWSALRIVGGAYGASCSYDPWAGSLAMTSHSDPDIARTVGVFAGLETALERVAWTPADIEQAAIACAREEETPVRPGMATDVGLWRHVMGITQEARRRWRQDQLEATPELVRQAALDTVRSAGPRVGTAILSSRSRLKQAAAALGQPITILTLSPRRGPA